MTPANYNLPDAYRGDSYGPMSFKFKNEQNGEYIDFSGSRVDLQVRNKRFKDVVVLSWSTSDGSIEIRNLESSTILLKQIPGERMRIPAGVYFYDLQIIKDEDTKTYLKGELSVIKDVTEI